ncbi:YDG domain-containing protein, partial [Herbaspirillum rubrisubalbicans]
ALGDTTNYTVSTSSQTNTTATIAKANVTIANVAVSDKVYDTTTNAALTKGSAQVQLGNASAANGSLANATSFTNLTLAGGFTDAAAGSNKTVNLNVALADTMNYTLSGATQLSTTATIAKASVTLGNVTASDKVYDTTTNASLTPGSAQVQLGNASTANGSLANATVFTNLTLIGGFANASAGNNKTVNLNVALADTTNYTLSGATQLSTTANIAKANVTVGNVIAYGKVYDMTINANIASAGTATVRLGNASAANGSLANPSAYTDYTVSGSFTNAAAGLQTVSLATVLADPANYSLASESQTTTTATIAKANVVLSNVVVSDKSYDGTTGATVSSSNGLVQLGDPNRADGSLQGASKFNGYRIGATFVNPAVGASKQVNLNATLFDSANYTIASMPTATTATILNNQSSDATSQIGSGAIFNGGQAVWIQGVATPLVITTLNISDPNRAIQKSPQVTPWITELSDRKSNASLFNIQDTGVKR